MNTILLCLPIQTNNPLNTLYQRGLNANVDNTIDTFNTLAVSDTIRKESSDDFVFKFSLKWKYPSLFNKDPI